MDLNEEIQSLLSKYRLGQCSPEELQTLFQWLEQQAATGKEWNFVDEDDRQTTRARIQSAVLKGTNLLAPSENQTPGRLRRRIMRMSAIAAALLTVGIAVWLLKPASQPAPLILSAGIGKVVRFQLPDESTVWLNNNTQLILHTDFANNRTIEIKKGEAFFDVKKDILHPFIVRSNNLNTVVLGTSFSVKLVPGETGSGTAGDDQNGEVKVSVKTGKVLVRSQHDTLGFIQPLQRLRYHIGSGMTTRDSVLNGEADSWTHGELFLQNAGLEEVTQWLQGHFPVTIENNHQTYAGTYYLQARSDISLPQLLKILNLLGTKNHVRFTLKDQKIIIQ